MPLDDDKGLTTKDFAKLVGCSVTVVHGWVSRGYLKPSGKSGKSNLFSPDNVDEMKAFHQQSKAFDPSKKKPMSTPVFAAATHDLKMTPSTEMDGHRHPVKITPVGESETLAFGPISVSTVIDNAPESAAMIPLLDPNFMFGASEAVILANALKNAEPTWVWGPSGSGKTSGINQICALLDWPVYRVNMSGDVTVSDFVGSTELVTDESGNAITKFVDGPLIRAMLTGGVLLIDEVTATPASVLMALQSVLERTGGDVESVWASGRAHTSFVNTANGGEIIHAHPRFRIIVTDNTNGQGNLTGAYAGTNVMNAAFMSRFTAWHHKVFPEGEPWSKMVTAKAKISFEDATRIVKVARNVNKGSSLLGSSKVTNQTMINPRDTLAVARLFKAFGDLKIAFHVGVLDSMDPADADRQFILDLINNME